MAATRLQQLTERIETMQSGVNRAIAITEKLLPMMNNEGVEHRALRTIATTLHAIDRDNRAIRDLLREKQAGRRSRARRKP